jgi:hypothetical protein
MRKLYKRVKLTDEQEDEFVFPHKMAMTGEKLHYKSEIAYELGTRDKRIAELEKDNDELELDALKRMRVVSELEKERDFILSKVGFDNGGFYLPCGNGRTDKEESIKNIKEALKEKG